MIRVRFQSMSIKGKTRPLMEFSTSDCMTEGQQVDLPQSRREHGERQIYALFRSDMANVTTALNALDTLLNG